MRLMLGLVDGGVSEAEGGDPLCYLVVNEEGNMLVWPFPTVNYEFFGFGCIKD